MPNRSRRPKTLDPAESAHRAVTALIDRFEGKPAKAKRKNPAAVALGRRGGLKGGHARAASMTPEQRAESARRAAIARWGRKAK